MLNKEVKILSSNLETCVSNIHHTLSLRNRFIHVIDLQSHHGANPHLFLELCYCLIALHGPHLKRGEFYNAYLASSGRVMTV